MACAKLAIVLLAINVHKLLPVCAGSCPSPCTCDRTEQHVNCSNGDVTTTEYLKLPEAITHLDLHRNNIEAMSNTSVTPYEHLVYLDLGDNALTGETVDPLAFHNTNLQVLNMSGNDLGLISEQPFPSRNVFIDHLPESLRELNLANCNLRKVSADWFWEPSRNKSDFHLLEFQGITLDHTESVSWHVRMPKLVMLNIAGNQLETIFGPLPSVQPIGNVTNSSEAVTDGNVTVLQSRWWSLHILNLSTNWLHQVPCEHFELLPGLQILDLSHNRLTSIPDHCFSGTETDALLMNLTYLSLSGNPIGYFQPGIFQGLKSLVVLDLSQMPNLTFLEKETFLGLTQLQYLDLSHAANLIYIHASSFAVLPSLVSVDLSYCGLTSLHPDTTAGNFTTRLAGNPWQCDCDLRWMALSLPQDVQEELKCSSPAFVAGRSIASRPETFDQCEQPRITDWNTTGSFKIGSQAILDCVVSGSPAPELTWITPHKKELHHHPAFVDHSLDPADASYHGQHHWHRHKEYKHKLRYTDRIIILPNGSLYIDYISRHDAGNYTCIVHNEWGNDTAVVPVMLDYHIMQQLMVQCVIVGFASANSLLVIAIVVSVIRYLAFRCSQKEKTRRKSIREVLNDIHDYKSAQIDRLKDYKASKFDQLSAFKSAKKEQFVAFKTAKIDKLRNYKQVTVASIFHQVERMRDHYHGQMTRIKDNCSQQAEKLRENYSSQRSRLKDYRAERVERLRDNYNAQVLKIRDYGAQQLERLREQYKLQQQYLLKLMELLDIGNCLTVIEAECTRTESMIFDPNISFDLEAKPVHVLGHKDGDSDGDSEYMTAGSHSPKSITSEPCSLFVQNEKVRHASSPGLASRRVQRTTEGNSRRSRRSDDPEARHRSRKRRRRKRRNSVPRGATSMRAEVLPPLLVLGPGERPPRMKNPTLRYWPEPDFTGSIDSLEFIDAAAAPPSVTEDDGPPQPSCSHAVSNLGRRPHGRPSKLSLELECLPLEIPEFPEFSHQEFRKRSLSDSISTGYESATAFTPRKEMATTPSRDQSPACEKVAVSSPDSTPVASDRTPTVGFCLEDTEITVMGTDNQDPVDSVV